MKNIEILNKYKKTINNYKSPISEDLARNLVYSDTVIPKPKLKLKKGIKIMAILTTIVATILVVSLNLTSAPEAANTTTLNATNAQSKNVDYQSISNNNVVKNSRTSDSYKAEREPSQEPQSIGSQGYLEVTDLDPILVQRMNDLNQKNKFKVLNSIHLDEAGLKKFGIKVENFYHNTQNPSITYNDNYGGTNSFAESESEFGMNFNFDSTTCIRTDPVAITNYDGTIRMSTAYINQGIDEYVPFATHLNTLCYLPIDDRFTNKDSIPGFLKPFLNDLQFELKRYNLSGFYDLQQAHKINDMIKVFLDQYSNILYTGMKTIKISDSSKYRQLNLKLNLKNITLDTYNSTNKILDSLNIPHEVYESYSHLINYLNEVLNLSELSNLMASLKKQAESYVLLTKTIALAIPFDSQKSDKGLIFWFAPTENFVKALPKDIAEKLTNEIAILQKFNAVCAAPIDKSNAFLGAWNTCSGAIENLSVYPNPIETSASVKFELKENRIMSFYVSDLQGNKIQSIIEDQKFNSGPNSFNINFNSIKPGLYFIVARSNNEEQVSIKVIK